MLSPVGYRCEVLLLCWLIRKLRVQGTELLSNWKFLKTTSGKWKKEARELWRKIKENRVVRGDWEEKVEKRWNFRPVLEQNVKNKCKWRRTSSIFSLFLLHHSIFLCFVSLFLFSLIIYFSSWFFFIFFFTGVFVSFLLKCCHVVLFLV